MVACSQRVKRRQTMSDSMLADMPPNRMWTLSDRLKVRPQVQPLLLDGLPEPLRIDLEFDAGMVDEILQRLTVLRAAMLPAAPRDSADRRPSAGSCCSRRTGARESRLPGNPLPGKPLSHDIHGGSMAAKKKTAAKRKAPPKGKTAAMRKKTAGRRELIDTGTNTLFVRRNERGTSFKKVVDAGKSITRDKRTKAKRKVPSGQGDKGDRR